MTPGLYKLQVTCVITRLDDVSMEHKVLPPGTMLLFVEPRPELPLAVGTQLENGVEMWSVLYEEKLWDYAIRTKTPKTPKKYLPLKVDDSTNNNNSDVETL